MPVDFDPSAAESALAGVIIPHVEWDASLDAILESLSDPAGARIVLGLGVPGFGKSELARTVLETVAAYYLPAMEADPNVRPVARIEAKAPDAGRSFGWREGFLEILKELGENTVDLRAGDRLDRSALIEKRGRTLRTRGERQLQIDVIDALNFHETKLLVIDEIEHIAYQKDVARFEASADILKTITNETGVRILATGSYEGIGFRSVSGQILRRMRPVHLRRYRAEVPAEFAEYTRCVAVALETIGYDGDPSPLVRALYRQSLGAVGTTVDLLMRAEHAWGAHGDSLVHGIVRNSQDDSVLEAVLAGIKAAEASFAPPPASPSRLDAMLGLAAAAVPRVPAGKGRATRRKGHVGRRGPSRDLVRGGR